MCLKYLIMEAYFGQEDIARSAEILGIPVNEIGIYFFTSEVHKKETLK